MIQSNHDHDKHHDALLQQVIMELQTLRMIEQNEQNEQQHSTTTTTTNKHHHHHHHHIRDRGMKFPPACYQYLLQYISGNQYCFDCQLVVSSSSSSSKTTITPKIPPTWANLHYGTLHCLQCSGIHRSYGVNISYIRSIQYDTFTYSQIISLLEGGNDQLYHFFHRHQLLPQQQKQQDQQCYQQHTTKESSSISLSSLSSPSYKYHTNAALYYKINLQYHIQNIIHHDTIYHGRQYNRNNQLLPPPSHIYIPNSNPKMDNITTTTTTTTTTNDDDTVHKITPLMISPCSSSSSSIHLSYNPTTLRRSKSPNSVVVTGGIDSEIIHHS